MKKCQVCKRNLHLGSFGKNRCAPDGLNYRCKECVAAWRINNKDKVAEQRRKAYQRDRLKVITRSKEWREQNRERYRQWQAKHRVDNADAYREKRLKAEYGISINDFDGMWWLQQGRCACCLTILTKTSGGAHVDHDHLTGTVRGLLCSSCNCGLGRFRDSFLNLLNAARYVLERGSIEEAADFLEPATAMASDIMKRIAAIQRDRLRAVS